MCDCDLPPRVSPALYPESPGSAMGSLRATCKCYRYKVDGQMGNTCSWFDVVFFLHFVDILKASFHGHDSQFPGQVARAFGSQVLLLDTQQGRCELDSSQSQRNRSVILLWCAIVLLVLLFSSALPKDFKDVILQVHASVGKLHFHHRTETS